MPIDEDLAQRVRELVEGTYSLSEKRMFGGLAFLVNGHLGIAVSGSGGLMVRADPAQAADVVDEPRVAPMVMRGRELKGWLIIAPEALVEQDDLRRWVQLGMTYAEGLPPT